MLPFLVLPLSGLLTIQAPDHVHVRSVHQQIVGLIDTGFSESATFRYLITTLNASNVIVYVEPNIGRDRLAGYLDHHVVTQGGYRYLRIFMRTHVDEERMIATLAHELQHAIEVADAPEVTDGCGIDELLRLIGFRFGCPGLCQETQAALAVQREVAAELKAHRAATKKR